MQFFARLNGWQRIGVVLSLLFGGYGFVFAFTYQPTHLAFFKEIEALRGLKGDELWEAFHLHAEPGDRDRLDICAPSTLELETSTFAGLKSQIITCDVSLGHKFGKGIFVALLFVLPIWVLGYSIAWIISGFRRRPA